MKPSREEREKLAGAIRRRRERSALPNARIAALAKVDPGQTSRILEGKFTTVSGNVLRICNVLGVDPQATDADDASPRQVRKLAAWAKLEASLRGAWDETPLGADRLVAVIDAVARVRPGRRSDRTDPDASVVGRHPG